MVAAPIASDSATSASPSAGNTVANPAAIRFGVALTRSTSQASEASAANPASASRAGRYQRVREPITNPGKSSRTRPSWTASIPRLNPRIAVPRASIVAPNPEITVAKASP